MIIKNIAKNTIFADHCSQLQFSIIFLSIYLSHDDCYNDYPISFIDDVMNKHKLFLQVKSVCSGRSLNWFNEALG